MSRRKSGKRAAAALAGLVLGLTGTLGSAGTVIGPAAVYADNADAALLQQLYTIRSLVNSDFKGNAKDIAELLGEAKEIAGEGSAVGQTLQSAKVLAEAGGDDAAALKVLIDRIIEILGGSVEEAEKAAPDAADSEKETEKQDNQKPEEAAE
ncbi:MAG: hypothetical protein Q4B09_09000, partial [Lachnospiraceae bacterium]|nr:hypothetical protein [Lachnospiraceae bacterium]